MSKGIMLSHLGGDALDQWERLIRWHRRLGPTRADLPEAEPAKSEALDDLWAFFNNCYHMGDWVSGAGLKSRQEVNGFIDQSEAMRICRDIANGVKHYRLDPGRPTSTSPNWTTTTVYTYASPAFGEKAHWIFVTDDGERRDLFQVADACIAAWRAFLDIGPGKRNPWGLRIRLP